MGTGLLAQINTKKSTMKIADGLVASMLDIEYGHAPNADGMVGLSNQGATCYLNSLLQALYMLPQFRSGVYACHSTAADDADADVLTGPTELTDEQLKETIAADNDSIPRQLQLLFARLQHSKRRSIETVGLTRAFGWTNADSFEQHDVLELFTQLLDAVEMSVLAAALESSEEEALLSSAGTGADDSPAQLFDGVLNNVITCTKPDGTPFRKVIPEAFKYISLYMDENTRSLEDALQRYVYAGTTGDP